MAVEIREIVIRAVISDDQEPNVISNSEGDALDKNKMVQECVNQVLKVLKNKNLR
ncbi:DUF5908 family protein [Aquimarina gracilis]|uniref:DUF5908 family protein n=1 Tax=Aquimarina gracilis TaxID=874422 RepID=A0ABU5ZPM8_9FLAO|nr:DUF5908 family protein [Aquimarina gracilis]MEB3344055.1 DUF5908 family protein [Aquimarina gracilis]